MPIDASLFAHIENDSSLSGTYALEGNRFINTVGYLNHYINLLAGSEPIPFEYKVLQEQMQYLVETEKKGACRLFLRNLPGHPSPRQGQKQATSMPPAALAVLVPLDFDPPSGLKIYAPQ